jgi:hypothetical protein
MYSGLRVRIGMGYRMGRGLFPDEWTGQEGTIERVDDKTTEAWWSLTADRVTPFFPGDEAFGSVKDAWRFSDGS